MTIGKDDGTGPTIGTWGTTYVDGNIFGGGRGFAGDAYIPHQQVKHTMERCVLTIQAMMLTTLPLPILNVAT